MPTTYAIPNGSTAFAATTYTGTNTTLPVSNAVNGVGFQPDLVWVKNRTTATAHMLQDSVRGATAYINSNTTSAENTNTASNWFRSFDASGFTVSNLTTGGANTIEWNNSGYNYVGWQWKAGGAAVTNTAGSISSQVSANPTAGFSVVTYTGTGANATVGHGLGVAPSMMILMNRDTTHDSIVWHTAFTATERIYLNSTDAKDPGAATSFNSTRPSSSVISLGSNLYTNGSTNKMVAYCWAAVPGYSAFGSYTGNGSTDGPFIYTGHRPRFVLTKKTTGGGNWYLWDSARYGYNGQAGLLYPESSNAEGNYGAAGVDLLSNGFKLRNADESENQNGGTYIYAAFAESPFNFANAR
jgi:hypothetical protein